MQELLVFCIWYVDEQLKSHEEFIGLHSLDSTTVPNIICTIEDIPLRLSLQLQISRGQCYDGASAMASCKTGVNHCTATLLSKNQLKLTCDTLDAAEGMSELNCQT